jgi:hypothetical protein
MAANRGALLGKRDSGLDASDTIRLYVPVMFWSVGARAMGRVWLKDLDVNGLLDRYHAIVTGRPVSEVLSRTKSRSYVARLSAVERELQARSDEEWLASLTKKEPGARCADRQAPAVDSRRSERGWRAAASRARL